MIKAKKKKSTVNLSKLYKQSRECWSRQNKVPRDKFGTVMCGRYELFRKTIQESPDSESQEMEVMAGQAMQHPVILDDFTSLDAQIAMETSIIRCRIAWFCVSVTALLWKSLFCCCCYCCCCYAPASQGASPDRQRMVYTCSSDNAWSVHGVLAGYAARIHANQTGQPTTRWRTTVRETAVVFPLFSRTCKPTSCLNEAPSLFTKKTHSGLTKLKFPGTFWATMFSNQSTWLCFMECKEQLSHVTCWFLWLRPIRSPENWSWLAYIALQGPLFGQHHFRKWYCPLKSGQYHFISLPEVILPSLLLLFFIYFIFRREAGTAFKKICSVYSYRWSVDKGDCNRKQLSAYCRGLGLTNVVFVELKLRRVEKAQRRTLPKSKSDVWGFGEQFTAVSVFDLFKDALLARANDLLNGRLKKLNRKGNQAEGAQERAPSVDLLPKRHFFREVEGRGVTIRNLGHASNPKGKKVVVIYSYGRFYDTGGACFHI